MGTCVGESQRSHLKWTKPGTDYTLERYSKGQCVQGLGDGGKDVTLCGEGNGLHSIVVVLVTLLVAFVKTHPMVHLNW